MYNILTYNNPGLKTLDVTTATGIGYKLIHKTAGVLEIGLSNIIITTAIANDAVSAIISLQLVRGGTTYTLATITLADGVAASTEVLWTPSTSVTLPGMNAGDTVDLTNNPFVELQDGDTIQTNVTTAGTDGSAAAGAYEANFIIRKSTLVGVN